MLTTCKSQMITKKRLLFELSAKIFSVAMCNKYLCCGVRIEEVTYFSLDSESFSTCAEVEVVSLNLVDSMSRWKSEILFGNKF